MNRRFFIYGLFILIVLMAFGLIGKQIYTGFLQNIKSSKEDLPITKLLTASDSAEFKHILNRIEIVQIRNSKVRNPIFDFVLDETYQMIVYKIPVQPTFDLHLLDFKTIDVDRTTRITYNIIDNPPKFRFQYKAGTVPEANKIFLTMSVDSLKTINYGDSAVCFEGYCKNFSIRYSEGDPIDLYFEIGNEDNILKGLHGIPIGLLLYHRTNFLYFYLLVSNKLNSKVPLNVLKSVAINPI